MIRALLPHGDQAIRRGLDVLSTLDLVRVNDRTLTVAGELQPTELRSLDAIHLATAQQFEAELNQIVTYDDRMAIAARAIGIRVAAPE